MLPDSVLDGLLAEHYGPLSPLRCVSLALDASLTQAPINTSTPPLAPIAPRSSILPMPQPSSSRPLDQNRPLASQKWKFTLKQAEQEAQAAAIFCKNKRLSGEFKTHADSCNCSNPSIIYAYKKAGYRYMDLIYMFTAKRRQVADQIDSGILTDAQGDQEASQFM